MALDKVSPDVVKSMFLHMMPVAVQKVIPYLQVRTSVVDLVDSTCESMAVRLEAYVASDQLMEESKVYPFRQTVEVSTYHRIWWKPWVKKEVQHEVGVCGEVVVTVKDFAAFPKFPYYPEDWGKPVRVQMVDQPWVRLAEQVEDVG